MRPTTSPLIQSQSLEEPLALAVLGAMPAWSVSKSIISLDFAPSNLFLPGPVTPLLDGTDALMLVKRQVPLDCVLYRYGSFSLTLDIVRESCLCWGPRKGGIS